MSRRPVIGMIMQTLPAIPGERPPCWLLGQRYVHVLKAAGAVPWVVPLMPDDPETTAEIADRLDGVFLTGGVDVDPSRYREDRLPVCGTPDPARDTVELAMLNLARGRDLPVFAVCRGMQLLNVSLGGTLYQDVASQVPAALKHDYFPTATQPSRALVTHDITVTAGSRLAGVLGGGVASVNSMHHQAIKDLAPGLAPTAYAPDGIIEAVEGTNGRYVVGVQWHPEELTDEQPAMRRLFTAFVEAANGTKA